MKFSWFSTSDKYANRHPKRETDKNKKLIQKTRKIKTQQSSQPSFYRDSNSDFSHTEILLTFNKTFSFEPLKIKTSMGLAALL